MAEELPKQLPKLLPILEQKFEELKKRWERFFMGLEKRPPLKERDNLKRLIFSIVDKKGYQYHLLYKAKQLAIKFNTYNNMWERMLRDLEEGKIQREKGVIQSPYQRTRKEVSSDWISIKDRERIEDGLEQLYERMKKESETRGIKVMNKEKFLGSLKKQLEKKLETSGEIKMRLDFSSGKPTIKIKKGK